jgi:hypothetical protein
MIKKIFIVALPLFAMMACNENVPEKDASIMPAKNAAVTDSGANQPAVNIMPATGQQPATVTTPAVTSAQPVTAGLNPAHGQPGHRCEIAVGAPLSSAPAAGSTPQQVVQNPKPVTMSTVPSKAPAGGTARINPAHGQPGHDCAVPVGQPLN